MDFLLRGLDSDTLIQRYQFLQERLAGEMNDIHRQELSDLAQDVLEILNRRGVRIKL